MIHSIHAKEKVAVHMCGIDVVRIGRYFEGSLIRITWFISGKSVEA